MPDPEALARLHGACFTQPRPWSAAEISALIARPDVVFLEAPHGFLLGQIILDEAEVLTLAVDPAQRRQGHARALLGRLCAAAAARGVQSVFLEVAANNPAAIALYLTAGFTQIGRRKGYYTAQDRPPVDALVLRKAFS